MRPALFCILMFLIVKEGIAAEDSDANVKVLSSWGRGTKGRWNPMVFRSNQAPVYTVRKFRVFRPPTKTTTIKASPPGTAGREVTTSLYQHKNAALLPSDCGTQMSRRIVNGETAYLNQFPWLVFLVYDGRYRCGGSLISSRYVLTARHCIPRYSRVYNVRLSSVNVGDHDLRTDPDCEGEVCSTARKVAIEETIAHDKYDLALLRLSESVQFKDNIRPICLPMYEGVATVKVGEYFNVAGWGDLGNSTFADVKQFVQLAHFEEGKCRQDYPIPVNPSIHICAGGLEDRKDSCNGDSGGPLMSVRNINGEFRFMAIGVLSGGPIKCGTPGLPGLYVRTFPSMRWILDNMRP